MVGACLGKEGFDRVWIRKAVEPLEKPKILFHEQEPFRVDVIVLDDSWKPLPEVNETRVVRTLDEIILRRGPANQCYFLVPNIDLLQSFRRGDDVNLIVGIAEQPLQISHVQVDAIRKVANHRNRGNRHKWFSRLDDRTRT